MFVCFFGYYLEVRELINVGVNVNFIDGKNLLFIVVCLFDLEFDLMDENDLDEDDIDEFFYLIYLIIVEDLIKVGV